MKTNRKLYELSKRSESIAKYSLAERFQISENIRVDQVIFTKFLNIYQ